MFEVASTTDLSASKHSSQFQSIEKTEDTPMFPKKLHEPPQLKEYPPSIDSSEGEDEIDVLTTRRNERSASGQLSQHSKYSSKHGLHSPIGSTHSFDLQVKLFMQNVYIVAIFVCYCKPFNKLKNKQNTKLK